MNSQLRQLGTCVILFIYFIFLFLSYSLDWIGWRLIYNTKQHLVQQMKGFYLKITSNTNKLIDLLAVTTRFHGHQQLLPPHQILAQYGDIHWTTVVPVETMMQVVLYDFLLFKNSSGSRTKDVLSFSDDCVLLPVQIWGKYCMLRNGSRCTVYWQ